MALKTLKTLKSTVISLRSTLLWEGMTGANGPPGGNGAAITCGQPTGTGDEGPSDCPCVQGG